MPRTTSTDIDALGDAIDQSTRSTGIPQIIAAGMVLNPKNISKLSKLIKYLKEDKALSDIDRAIYYIKTKYPTLSSRLSGIVPDISNIESKYQNSVRGYFSPSRNEVHVNPDLNFADAVSTIAHEMVHARQNQKGAKWKRTVAEAFKDLNSYYYDPLEIYARRGGQTAGNTLNTILKSKSE